MKPLKLLLAPLALLVALVGCGSGSAGAPPPRAPATPTAGAPPPRAPTTPTLTTTDDGGGSTDGSRSHGPGVADVAGRTYVSTSVRGDVRLVRGTRITLSFTLETLTASTGCATLSGPYSLAGDGLQMTGEVTRTEIGCAPALARQDDWLAGFLTAQSSSQLVGTTLSLGGDGVYITLAER